MCYRLEINAVARTRTSNLSLKRKGLTTMRSRRRRVGGVGAEAGWRGGGGGVGGGGESEDVSDAPESF
jgi:hypothetical protein